LSDTNLVLYSQRLNVKQYERASAFCLKTQENELKQVVKI